MTARRIWRAACRRGRAALAVVVVVLAVVVLAACADRKDEFTYLRIQVDGQSTLAIGKDDVLVRGIVMYFHGLNQDEFSMSALHRDLTKDLVDAGFVVVSSKANGNDFADPKAISAYQQLGSMAMQHYSISDIYFLAESVGAIPAMNLLAANYSPLRGMAAVDPVLDATPPAVSEDAAGAESTVQVQSPFRIAPGAFTGQRIRFYLSSGQSSARSGVTAFKHRFGPIAGVDVIDCPDMHSCPPSRDVLDWFLSLESHR